MSRKLKWGFIWTKDYGGKNHDAFVKINVVHDVTYYKLNMFYSRLEGQAGDKEKP